MTNYDDISLNAAWYGFRTATIPATATVGQLADMKASFFAGAVAVLGILESLGEAPDDVGDTVMSRIADECMAFATNG